jgi:hypothetical protein
MSKKKKEKREHRREVREEREKQRELKSRLHAEFPLATLQETADYRSNL